MAAALGVRQKDADLRADSLVDQLVAVADPVAAVDHRVVVAAAQVMMDRHHVSVVRH